MDNADNLSKRGDLTKLSDDLSKIGGRGGDLTKLSDDLSKTNDSEYKVFERYQPPEPNLAYSLNIMDTNNSHILGFMNINDRLGLRSLQSYLQHEEIKKEAVQEMSEVVQEMVNFYEKFGRYVHMNNRTALEKRMIGLNIVKDLCKLENTILSKTRLGLDQEMSPQKLETLRRIVLSPSDGNLEIPHNVTIADIRLRNPEIENFAHTNLEKMGLRKVDFMRVFIHTN